MTHRIARYEAPDGTEKWAIWSTVVDDWTHFDLSEEELVRTESKHGTEGLRKVRERVERIKENGRTDPRYRGMLPPDEAIEALEEGRVEGEDYGA